MDPKFSDLLSSYFDFSEDSSDKRRRRKNKNKYRKLKKIFPIKLCLKLTANLLMTVYKSKVLKFKLDEGPLHCRIFFLTLIESLEMIFNNTRKLVW